MLLLPQLSSKTGTVALTDANGNTLATYANDQRGAVTFDT
jgi:hypothetical protein